MEEASENEQLLSGQEDVEEEEPDVNFSSETQQKELIDENSIPQHLDVSPVSADNSGLKDSLFCLCKHLDVCYLLMQIKLTEY